MSKCLSADVNAGLDPTFKDVMESRNAAKLNYGAVVTKYTGSRGKSSTNDAHAEFMAKIRNIFDGFKEKESEGKASVYMPLVDFYKEYVEKEKENKWLNSKAWTK